MLYPGLQPVQRKPRDQWLAVSSPFGLSEGRNSRRDNSIENKKIKTIFPHCHRDHRWKRDLDRSKNTRSEVAFSRQVFSLTAEHRRRRGTRNPAIRSVSRAARPRRADRASSDGRNQWQPPCQGQGLAKRDGTWQTLLLVLIARDRSRGTAERHLCF